jgi:molybdopterin/thiamine biosynthesis adenylyltransferase
MTTKATIDILVWAAKEHGLSEVCVLSSEELRNLPQNHGVPAQGVRGVLDVAGKAATVTLAVKFTAPCCLPLVFMKPWDIFGVIPHVETDGFVCFAENQGLIIDPSRFDEVIGESLKRALSQISKGVRGENLRDFANEFLPYWNRQKDILIIESFVEPTLEPKLVQVFTDGSTYKYVCDRESDKREYLSGFPMKHLTQRNALYVALPAGTVITPPHPDSGWSPKEAIISITEHIDCEVSKAISKLSRKLKKREEFVVIYLPKLNGHGGSLFGIICSGVREAHPLAGGTIPISITSVKLSRRDRPLVLSRGGADMDLHDKRILIVGCGSIGGFLGVELARAGVGRLMLVDHDQFEHENLFRHVLGMKHLYKNKAESLKEYITENIPYMEVNALPKRIEEALKDEEIDFSRLDATVVALGDSPTELYLNRLAQSEKDSFPPFIFTWVEAYGIGGHVQVSNNGPTKKSEGGCLECLYTSLPGDRSGLHCRAAFAQAGQKFGQNISGCSGLFMPYGSTLAVRAAILATETVVNVLLGIESGNPLLSFKGPSSEFTARGYALADRYIKLTDEELYVRRYDYKNPKCQCYSNS